MSSVATKAVGGSCWLRNGRCLGARGDSCLGTLVPLVASCRLLLLGWARPATLDRTRFHCDPPERSLHHFLLVAARVYRRRSDARRCAQDVPLYYVWVAGHERHELPPLVEHLEAVVADMWVRTEVGAVHRDPLGDRMFVQTLLSKGPAQDAM
jgi:hypothetical protein